MQKSLYFCLFFSFFISTSSAPFFGKNPPEGKNYTNSNQVVTNVTINTSVAATFVNEIVNTFWIKLTEYAQEAREMLSNLYEYASNAPKSIFWRHKWKFAFGATAGSYSTLVGTIFYLRKELQQSTHWYFWKHNLSMEELFSIPQEDLSKELIFEIQRRYCNPNKPTDVFTPFALFINDIEFEKKALMTYRKIGDALQKISVAEYAFYDKDLKEQCEKWLERAVFFKSVFLHWLANYKIDQYLSKEQRCLRFISPLTSQEADKLDAFLYRPQYYYA